MEWEIQECRKEKNAVMKDKWKIENMEKAEMWKNIRKMCIIVRCYDKMGHVREMAKAHWVKWQMNRCPKCNFALKKTIWR